MFHGRIYRSAGNIPDRAWAGNVVLWFPQERVSHACSAAVISVRGGARLDDMPRSLMRSRDTHTGRHPLHFPQYSPLTMDTPTAHEEDYLR